MNKWKKQIPEGVQDYLPAECYAKERLAADIGQVFFQWGYQMVETPVLEYMDVFTGSHDHFNVESMFKFSSANGRLLVLRPDITLPIARMVTTRLAGARLPLRLCYKGDVFSYIKASNGRNETTQAGIELIGDGSVCADAEVIAVAAAALKKAGLCNIQLEIGQVGFFKGLMEEAGLDADTIEELRKLVDQKNMLAVELLLQKVPMSADVRARLMKLPRLFGGEEVLDEAEAMSAQPRCRAAVANLREIWSLLTQYGLGENISIDLGMLHSIDYYTGLVFRGLTEGIGAPVLTGGRYDNLLSEFGNNVSATGFGLDVSRTLVALEAQSGLACPSGADTAIIYKQGYCAQAFTYADTLRAVGQRVLLVHEPPEDLDAFMRDKGITQLCEVNSEGVRTLNIGGEQA